MQAPSRQFRQRWTLPLAAVLLLHWTLGFCEALADVLCIEADGRVTLEAAGEPCEKAGQGDPCIDLKAGDAHDGCDPAPAPQFAAADLVSPFFLPAPALILPLQQEPPVFLPQSTGPPSPPLSLILRNTAVLLI